MVSIKEKDRVQYNCLSLNWIFVLSLVFINIFGAYPSTIPLMLPFIGVKALTLCSLIFYLVILLRIKKVAPLPVLFSQLIIIQIISWSVFWLLHKDGVYLTRIIYSINAYLALLCLNQFKGGIFRFTKCFDSLMLIMAILGTVAFALVLFDLLRPILIYENVDGREGYFYGLTCTNAKFMSIIRYSGIFDEPGAMAGWGVYALILNRFVSNNRKIENLLIFFLLFTFSMAYYIQLIIFFLFFKLKNIKQIIIGILCVIVVMLFIVTTKDTDIDIYKITIERFETDNSGKLNGDNRSNLAVKAKKYFKNSPIIGNGPTYIQEIDYMGDNPYESLASDGIIGSLIMYLPLLIVCFPFNKNVFGAIVVLSIGYLQRPFHCHLIHFMLMYTFVLSIIFYRRHIKINGKKISENHSNYCVV